MAEIYFLQFIKDWGTFRAGDVKMTESKITREALVDTYKVAIEMGTPEKPQDLGQKPPASPLQGGGDIVQSTPEKSPVSPIPGGLAESARQIYPLPGSISSHRGRGRRRG